MEKNTSSFRLGGAGALDIRLGLAHIVRLEDFGLGEMRSGQAVSGAAVLLQASEHLLRVSRSDNGFWHRFGIITSEANRTSTALVYVRADTELHVLAMNNAEPEVLDLLVNAQSTGVLRLLWVAPSGDQRLSLLQYDDCLSRMHRQAPFAGTSVAKSSLYDTVLGAKYAIDSDALREVGVDIKKLHTVIVHCLTTLGMLDQAGQLARSMTATKH